MMIMSGTLFGGAGRGRLGAAAGLFLWAAGLAGPLAAQAPSLAKAPPAASPGTPIPTVSTGGGVEQAGCASCSSGLLGAPGPDISTVHPGDGGGCGGDGCGGPCYPGRKPCDCCCDGEGPCGHFLCGLYQCICCPDPCYEPHWVALQDSAFFQDGPRPITQMKLIYQDIHDVQFPDKAEFFEARFKNPICIGKNLLCPHSEASFRDFFLYNEAALGNFSLFTQIAYQQTSIGGTVLPPGAAVPMLAGQCPAGVCAGKSGFGDMVVGTKSMLLDCELIQFTFQMKTFIPTGDFTKGLGTGHVSLEPAFLTAVKLTPDLYFQGEVAYWFPIGGDMGGEGPVLHYHLALNKTLWNCGHDVQLIGTCELNGWEILGGTFSDPGQPIVVNNQITPALKSAKSIGNIVSAGPGIRLVVCDKIDIGVAGAFAITDQSMGDEVLRAEFRWRF
jgi:hypothetical protein